MDKVIDKSIFTIKIGDKERGFKFGTYSMAITCNKEKCSLGTLLDKITTDSVEPLTVLHVIYGGAVSYCKTNKIPVDFEVEEVADWLDLIGFQIAMKLLKDGIDVYEPKNWQAPGTGQKLTTDGQLETANI